MVNRRAEVNQQKSLNWFRCLIPRTGSARLACTDSFAPTLDPAASSRLYPLPTSSRFSSFYHIPRFKTLQFHSFYTFSA